MTAIEGKPDHPAEREVIAMATNGATAPEIAAKFKTSVKTIERKARALGISIRSGGRSRSD